MEDAFWEEKRSEWYDHCFADGRVADFMSATIGLPRVNHAVFPALAMRQRNLLAYGTQQQTGILDFSFTPRLGELLASRAMANEVRDHLGELTHMPAGNIWFDDNTTSAFEFALRVIRPKQLLLTDQEYGSIRMSAEMYAEIWGATVDFIPGNATGVVNALKKHDKPYDLFVASAVTQGRCEVLPIRKLTSIAKTSGARVLIDGAQAIGHLPFPKGDYDAVIGCGHKWLHGMTASGFVAFKEPQQLSPYLGATYLSAPDNSVGDLEKFVLDKADYDGDGRTPLADLHQSLQETATIGWKHHFRRIKSLGAFAYDLLKEIPEEQLLILEGKRAPGMIAFTMPYDLEAVADTLLVHTGSLVRYNEENRTLRISLDPTVTFHQIVRLALGLHTITTGKLPLERNGLTNAMFDASRNLLPINDELYALRYSRLARWPANDHIDAVAAQYFTAAQ